MSQQSILLNSTPNQSTLYYLYSRFICIKLKWAIDTKDWRMYDMLHMDCIAESLRFPTVQFQKSM